jgi:hypothetical protein
MKDVRFLKLLEVFGDPMFENLDVITPDVNELAAAYPGEGAGEDRRT